MAKILLVEDDVNVSELVALRLEIAGHEVVTAVNGKIGVEKAPQASHDIILMDMHMPVMGGHEAVRILRNSGYTGLIVALTASAMSSAMNEALRSGCDGVIIKPITEKFEEQVNKFIEDHAQT